MLILGKTLVSEEILQNKFACQIQHCKGACCIEGDYGAPLENEEIDFIDKNLPFYMPYISEESKEIIEQKGFYERDSDGDWVTRCRPTGECVFANYSNDGALYCTIEKAFLDGNSSFQKPISCHLYPIRAKPYGEYLALNYHHWDICSEACKAGAELSIPVHRFLKSALIRKMGNEWYEELDAYYSQNYH